MLLGLEHEHELAERGYTVLRAFASADLTAAARQMMDRLLGGRDAIKSVDPRLHQVGRRWPAAPPSPHEKPSRFSLPPLPLITTGQYRHTIMHPIADPAPARLLTECDFMDLYCQLLQCSSRELRLVSTHTAP